MCFILQLHTRFRYMLIEVEYSEDACKSLKISNFKQTATMVVPKRDANEISKDTKKDSTATTASAAETTSPAKKSKPGPPLPTAGPSPIKKPQPIVNVWSQFNEALGRNRKQRCDKLTDLLKWSNIDNPKVLSDLQSSGVTFKITTNKHFTPNVEFKSSLIKCKRLMTAFPVPKRALMLFRAITDTASDGQLGLLDHVGIHINLQHANMEFLVRKIRAKSTPVASPVKEKPSRYTFV